tara:strand:- start:640 stop:975 length:336 start_codon:yes stop_codon:yes gene_type:complete
MINPRPIMILMLLCISLLILLQGCAAPGFIAGTSATTATGSYQTFKTVSLMKAGVDTALAAEGKKTTTDHVVSTITGMDCKAMRIIEEEALQVYCLQTKPDFLSPLREEKE